MQVLKSTVIPNSSCGWPLQVRQCSMNLALHFVFKRKHKYLCCCGMVSQNSPIFLAAPATLSCLYIVSKFSTLADSYIYYIYLTGDCPHSVSSWFFLFPNFSLRTQRAPGLPRFWRSPCSDRDHLVRTNQLTQTNPLTQTQADLSQGNWVLHGSSRVIQRGTGSCKILQILLAAAAELIYVWPKSFPKEYCALEKLGAFKVLHLEKDASLNNSICFTTTILHIITLFSRNALLFQMEYCKMWCYTSMLLSEDCFKRVLHPCRDIFWN